MFTTLEACKLNVKSYVGMSGNLPLHLGRFKADARSGEGTSGGIVMIRVSESPYFH